MSKKFFLVISILVLLLNNSIAAYAAIPVNNSNPKSFEQIEQEIDLEELQIFVDTFFTESLTKYRVPGAAVAIVLDGQILLSRGYGYANLQTQVPFSPETTLVHAKSISKLFTATAAMQLVEQGKLDLQADVNQYIQEFQLKKRFSEPVTLAQLLTHTSGYVDRDIGTMAWTATELIPLGEYLAKRMPPQLYPPGDRVSYSDHNMTLVGYLVETKSGETFDEYIDAHILMPLEMQHSSFAQPIPETLATNLAVGYTMVGDAFQPVLHGYWNVAPAVSLVTTANDLAHFMIAHLENGQYSDQQILQATTIQEMHSQQFTQHPKLPGLAYGFWEHFENGRRFLMHAGEGAGFANMLVLLPEEHMGFTILCNRTDFLLEQDFMAQFLDRYYPALNKTTPPEPLEGYQERSNHYAGSYTFYRHDPLTIDKLDVFGNNDRIWANEDGSISSTLFPGRFIEAEPLFFRRIDGEGMLTFREDDQGRITHLFTDGWPYAYDRQSWYQQGGFQEGVLSTLILMFISGIIAWCVWIFRHRKSSYAISNQSNWAWTLTGIVSGLNLFFIMALLLTATTPEGGIGSTTYGMPTGLIALLAIPHLTAGLTIGLVIYTILTWKHSWWKLPWRIYYSTLTCVALVFIWFTLYWNILGFKF